MFNLSAHRKSIVRLFVGVISFIFFGFFLPIYLSNQSVSSLPFSTGPTPTFAPPRTTVTMFGRDALQVIATELETYTIGKTWYMAYHCLKDQMGARCDPSVYKTSYPGFLIPVLDGLYSLTGEQAYKLQADSNFSNILEECLQNSQFCDEQFFALISRYRTSSDPRIPEALKRIASYTVSKIEVSVPGRILQIHKLLALSSAVGDGSLSIVAGAKYKQLVSDTRTDEDNPVVATLRSGVLARKYDCGRYWVGLELSETSGDAQLFTEAKTFFDGRDEYMSSMTHLGAVSMCLEGLEVLYRKTGEAKYQQAAKETVEYVLANFWDTPIDQKYTGDYGILLYNYYKSPTNQVLNFKYLNEGAWFTSHLVPFGKTLLRF